MKRLGPVARRLERLVPRNDGKKTFDDAYSTDG